MVRVASAESGCLKRKHNYVGRMSGLSKSSLATSSYNHQSGDQLLSILKVLHMQMALKVADIAHLAAKTEVHKRWTQQLTEEFFRQVWIHLIELLQHLY